VTSAVTAIDRAQPRSLPQPLTTICAAFAVIGAAAFAYGLISDPQSAWLAYHTNFVYFATLSQAGLIWACIFVIVGANWPGPIRRIVESLAAWVPVSLVLACIGYFGGEHIFEWYREGAVHGKETWLNPTRFYVTDIGILAVLTVLSLSFLKTSVRPTLGGVTQHMSGFAKGMAERWTAGWRGEEEEREASLTRLRTISPIICLIFAMGYSVIAFDQVMSMEQTWFSNLFGAFVSWGGMLSSVAATALIAVLMRNSPGLEGHITEERLHDLGKMLFAFSIFWMYLFFSQYLVIWYGNLPEETLYLRDRLGPQFVIDKGFTESAWALAWTDWNFKWSRLSEAYGWMSMVVWFCLWVIPFWVLLGQRPKKTPAILGTVAAIVVIGFWLERNLLVWPSVVKDDNLAWAGPIPLLIGLGFFGAFGLVYLVYTRLFPSLAVPEPASGS